MKYITYTDTIFITIMQLGRTLEMVRLSGIVDASHLKEKIAELSARFTGMVNIVLRNGSQGWNYRYNLVVG